MKEKTYFRFKIFSKVLECIKIHSYTDRETGKEYYNKVLRFRESYDSNSNRENKDLISFYTGKHFPTILYKTCGYSDPNHNFQLSVGWGFFIIYFPWKNNKPEVAYGEINNEQPKYGFTIYNEQGISELNMYWGMHRKTYEFPWSIQFYKHTVMKDGSMVEQGSHFSGKHIEPDIVKLPFRYIRKDGLVQQAVAHCFIEQREWRRKWLKFTTLFNRINRTVDIEFKDESGNYKEIGNSSNNWKGGTIGCSCPMTDEEFFNRDIESALRRYETKVNLNKAFN